MKLNHYRLLEEASDDTATESVTVTKAEYEAMKAKIEAMEKNQTREKPEEDLTDKAQRIREEKARVANDTKYLEAALTFNLNAEKFLKDNQSLLPKDIADIFAVAQNEKYDSAIEKANALKAGVIQSFFAVQDNLDLLTPALKNQLEDYLKLTKNGKQERAQQIFDSIFEPAFETLRRVKKAEALAKGHGGLKTGDDAYKKKMIDLGRRQYLKETK